MDTRDSLQELKARIRRLEGSVREAGGGVLPLGLTEIDILLPEGGLPLGTLHDMRGDPGPLAGFTAFLLGLVAKHGRPVLWIDATGNLYLPGLLPYGLDAGNLIVASGIAGDKATLWALEEALATSALGAVAACLERPDFTAMRRLSLAAREKGVTAFLMRRMGEVGASPAVTRWHVGAAPSRRNGLPGIGVMAWMLTLEKCRNGPQGLTFQIAKGEAGWKAELDRPDMDETLVPALAG